MIVSLLFFHTFDANIESIIFNIAVSIDFFTAFSQLGEIMAA